MGDNSLSSIRLNLAIVLHATIEDIEKLKKFLETLPEVRVIYQKADSQRLYVITEAERGKANE